jgi:hypothetical protein
MLSGFSFFLTVKSIGFLIYHKKGSLRLIKRDFIRLKISLVNLSLYTVFSLGTFLFHFLKN